MAVASAVAALCAAASATHSIMFVMAKSRKHRPNGGPSHKKLEYY